MATQDPDMYLAILKASYNYEPQSEDEIAIEENQLLLLIERVDEEWWKVKIKGTSQDTDGPIGLVPAAYVEQAEHTSTVKALYTYEAAAHGELSVHEDDVLMVFDTEDDWILVQNSIAEGGAGYVPGNYVEVIDGLPAPVSSRIVVPDSPPPPVSTYVDPADRVASTKVDVGDGIQTWHVSEIDKKGKKKKGTLGIGSGAVFFASEADKTPVQKWQTKDIATVVAEKSKHVRIDIEGPSPISLHFHAGSKENADAIVNKLHSSKALASISQEYDKPIARNLPPPLDMPPSSMKKPSVHFSLASPVIIPSAPDDDDDEEEEEEGVEEQQNLEPLGDSHKPQPASAIEEAVALYDFVADGVDELSVAEGERLTVLEKDGDEWWKCRNSKGLEGVVPASYLEAVNDTATNESSVDEAEAKASDELAKEREAALLRQEQEEKERQQREAAAARKLETQRKAKASAAAAEAERQKRKVARASSPPTQPRARDPPTAIASSSKSSSDTARSAPDPEKTRVWHDRSGQFRVDAAFLGFNNGKLRLHKVNGVIVEVPSEKMSIEDMRYVEGILDKKNRSPSTPRVSEDDLPLAISKVTAANARVSVPPPKKGPKIDWFDFFLSAGCDVDDCTRYAASFEKDKIDETILGDITDGTMRSLGLREGDIIRVSKAIEKRKPTDNLTNPSPQILEQLRRDEELARQLQAQEISSSSKGVAAPNLFAGPGGVLKPRRGRPQPSKSLPPSNVDLKAITSASDQIQRTSSPQILSPATAQSPVSAPPRPNSASIGFDDDAWTNRPSSTKPSKATSPSSTPRAASVPPIAVIAKSPTPTPTTAPSPPQPTPTAVPQTAIPQASASQAAPALSNKTESDIFEQLARLSELRKPSTPAQPNNVMTPTLPAPSGFQTGIGMGSSPLPNNAIMPTVTLPAPSGFQPRMGMGMGMGSSPFPMGQHLANQAPDLLQSSQVYNGPRGPFAPVPANQGLLQPLIPTQTGFGGFVPTKPAISPFSNSLSSPPFLSQQPTSFSNPQPILSQPTGNVFNPINPISPFQGNNGGFSPVQPQPTGFNGSANSSLFNAPNGPTSYMPPNATNNTSPANVFAQMKSGTFATDNDSNHNMGLGPHPSQTPMWSQPYQGYTGYPH